ncbi:MAG TPA: hypothetical protein VNY06_01125 [Methylocella sp.]|jgi:hypothetical protein|nr:hypothetical protein [Methylocella sp.]
MSVICNCGAEVPEPGMYCSATTIFICQGREPKPGCGHLLTAEERHWYGSCCEDCEQRWSDRIGEWCDGARDAELDAMFGSNGQSAGNLK